MEGVVVPGTAFSKSVFPTCCSTSITWEFVRNVHSLTLAQTCWIQNPGVGFSTLCLRSPPGDSDACSNSEASVWSIAHFIQVFKFTVILMTLWEDSLLFSSSHVGSVLTSSAFHSQCYSVVVFYHVCHRFVWKKRHLFHYPFLKCHLLQEWLVLFLLIHFCFVCWGEILVHFGQSSLFFIKYI